MITAVIPVSAVELPIEYYLAVIVGLLIIALVWSTGR